MIYIYIYIYLNTITTNYKNNKSEIHRVISKITKSATITKTYKKLIYFLNNNPNKEKKIYAQKKHKFLFLIK